MKVGRPGEPVCKACSHDGVVPDRIYEEQPHGQFVSGVYYAPTEPFWKDGKKHLQDKRVNTVHYRCTGNHRWTEDWVESCSCGEDHR